MHSAYRKHAFIVLVRTIIAYDKLLTFRIMGKGKKGGKRMNKAQLTEKLQEFFASQPGVTLSFKEIFRGLHLTKPCRCKAENPSHQFVIFRLFSHPEIPDEQPRPCGQTNPQHLIPPLFCGRIVMIRSLTF